MSYDLEIAVKVDGCDKYATIATPQYDSPTYNLGKMFRECMSWDFKQGEYYKCVEVEHKIARGLKELELNADEYKRYEPSNGWGTIVSARLTLRSLLDCIYETAEEIPLNCLYMRW